MIRKYLAYLFIHVAVVCIGCESISSEEKTEEYPVLIEKVDRETLEALNEVYHQSNDGLICSPLNEYALTGFSRVLFPDNINPCLNRVVINKEVQFESRFIESAKQSLLKNSEFTGVTKIDDLVVSEINPLEGCTICEGPDINNVPLQWKFEFKPQNVNGIEVSGTKIVVYMDANGVNRIWGNWFEIADPGFVEFGSIYAEELLMGKKLRYANEKNQIFEQEITKEHIKNEPELRYSPIEFEDRMEIHKTWEITILQESTNIPRWKVYISTVNGDVVSTTLL